MSIKTDDRLDQPADEGTPAAAAETTPEAPGDSIQVIMERDGYELLFAHPRALYLGKDVTENTRQTVIEDEVFSSSVEQFGVDIVIEARRDHQGRLAVHDGKMRTLAALKAGLDKLLVLVRPSNDDDDERDAVKARIFSQLRINERRADITTGDKMAALHQLVLLEVTPQELATQRHMPLKDAKKLHTAVQSKAAVQASRNNENLTLDDMLLIAGFEAEVDHDPEAVEALTQTAQTNRYGLRNKAYELMQQRRDADLLRPLQAKFAKSKTPIVTAMELAADNDSAALTALRPSPAHEPGTALTPAAHKNCPGNVVLIDFEGHGETRKAVPVHLCRDFRGYGHAMLDAPKGVAALKPVGKMTPEELADRRLTIKFNGEWPLSIEPRQAWMAEKFREVKYPKGFRIHRRTAQLAVVAGYEFKRAIEHSHPLLRECLAGAATSGEGVKPALSQDALQKRIDGASEEHAAMLTLGLWAFAVEARISKQKSPWKNAGPETVLLMTILKELGMGLSPVENYILGLDDDGRPLDGTAGTADVAEQVEASNPASSSQPVAA